MLLGCTLAPLLLCAPAAGAAGRPAVLKIAWVGNSYTYYHDLPLLLERINGHFGYRAVENVHFIQAPIPIRKQDETPEAEADPAIRAQVADLVADVEDDELRQSLERLGQSILSRAASDQSK